MVDPIETIVDLKLLMQQLLDLFPPNPAATPRILGLLDGAPRRFLLRFA